MKEEMFYMLLCIILLPLIFIIMLVCRPFNITYDEHIEDWKLMKFIEGCTNKALDI